MIFTIILICMILIAVACVAIPLVKRTAGSRNSNQTALDEHAQRLKSLDRRLKKGELETPDYLAARRQLEEELQKQLASVGEEAPVSAHRPRWIAAGVTTVCVSVLAVSMYLFVGNWQVATGHEKLAANQSVNKMVAGLVKRLNTTDSNDAQGWTMLGRSYVVMGRYADAVPAYAHAYALLGDTNHELLADYAEAIILANPADLTTKAAPLLNKALAGSPDNPKALWYGGLLALKQDHKALAIKRWQKILDQNPPAGIRKMVEQRIEDTGGKVVTSTAATTAGKFVIPVHIALARRLKAKLPSGATLFVFVRSTDSKSGPPLLARRLKVDRFPADLKLTQANAMMPGTTLAGYKQVEVMARVALKDTATAQPGDLQGGTLFKLNARSHIAKITISNVIH